MKTERWTTVAGSTAREQLNYTTGTQLSRQPQEQVNLTTETKIVCKVEKTRKMKTLDCVTENTQNQRDVVRCVA